VAAKDGAAKDGAGKDGAGKDAAAKPAAPPELRIDFDGIDQRILALPLPRANYQHLETGTDGVLFAASAPVSMTDEDYLEADDAPRHEDVVRFDLNTRKSLPLLKEIDGDSLAVSADGGKMLFARARKWFVTGSDSAPKEGDGAIKADDLRVWVDPRAEWRQMYHEAWRIERDFFYDAGFHGLDLVAAERTYLPFVEGIASRADLNVLFEEMTGHLSVGHTFIRGGAMPDQGAENGGLLGARVRRRELESEAGRAIDAARRQRGCRRLSSRGERPVGRCGWRSGPVPAGNCGEANGADRWEKPRWQRIAPSHGGAGGLG
jgi:tricorn protease